MRCDLHQLHYFPDRSIRIIFILILLFDQILGLGARRRSQPQNGRSRLPMARGSFGCSLDNILTSFTDDFFCFSFSPEPRLICRTVQGVLLRERHSGSNTNHLWPLSNGESCIHLSPFLLCCLIEICDLRFALQARS